jgi:hypothetical protein
MVTKERPRILAEKFEDGLVYRVLHIWDKTVWVIQTPDLTVSLHKTGWMDQYETGLHYPTDDADEYRTRLNCDLSESGICYYNGSWNWFTPEDEPTDEEVWTFLRDIWNQSVPRKDAA